MSTPPGSSVLALGLLTKRVMKNENSGLVSRLSLMRACQKGTAWVLAIPSNASPMIPLRAPPSNEMDTWSTATKRKLALQTGKQVVGNAAKGRGSRQHPVTDITLMTSALPWRPVFASDLLTAAHPWHLSHVPEEQASRLHEGECGRNESGGEGKYTPKTCGLTVKGPIVIVSRARRPEALPDP